MSDKGDCRTALATPGLLKSIEEKFFLVNDTIIYNSVCIATQGIACVCL